MPKSWTIHFKLKKKDIHGYCDWFHTAVLVLNGRFVSGGFDGATTQYMLCSAEDSLDSVN